MKKLWDVNPGFGGPLVRDKLWFFTTVRHNGWQNNPGGFIANLNGGNPDSFAYAPDSEPAAVGRQLVVGCAGPHHVAGDAEEQDRLYLRQAGRGPADRKRDDGARSGHTEPVRSQVEHLPRLDSPADEPHPPRGRGRQRLRALSEHAGRQPLFRARQAAHRDQRPGVRGNLPRVDGVTSHWTNNNYYYRASLAYVTGAHNFKLGFNNAGGTRDALTAAKIPAISYRVNSGVPNQITQQAIPTEGLSRTDADLGSTRRIDGRCAA